MRSFATVAPVLLLVLAVASVSFPIQAASGTVYWASNVDDPAAADDWSQTADGWVVDEMGITTRWSLVNQTEWGGQLPIGPRSGDQYWHAGWAVPETGYNGGAGHSLEAPTVDIGSNPVSPQIEFWAAGGSEEGWDRVEVWAYDGSLGEGHKIGEFSGSDGLNDYFSGYQKYTYNFQYLVDDENYAGSIVFTFKFISDLIIEEGPGWNIDDLRVVEA